jgi:hypothetical protein
MLEGFARGDTCSVESIQGWLEELCEQEESAGDPGVIDVSAYHQSEEYVPSCLLTLLPVCFSI